MSRRRPVWTRARLERVMRLRFGTTAAGRVDTRAAAAAMGVSQRTVQRWLHAAHGRSVAHIPPRRLQQLIELLLPSEETRIKEAQAARYAAKAIDGLRRSRKRSVKPPWEKQRWLEPHVVAVLEVRVGDLRIRQLAIGRAEAAKVEQIRRRGTILDETVVPTRFHATLLAHQVLTDLAQWRFQAGTGQVAQGYTQAWVGDAPATNLSRDAATLSTTGQAPRPAATP